MELDLRQKLNKIKYARKRLGTNKFVKYHAKIKVCVRSANKELNSNGIVPPNQNKPQIPSFYKKLTGLLPVLRFEISSHTDVTTALVMCRFLLYPLMGLGEPSTTFNIDWPKARYSGKRLQFDGIFSHATSRSESVCQRT